MEESGSRIKYITAKGCWHACLFWYVVVVYTDCWEMSVLSRHGLQKSYAIIIISCSKSSVAFDGSSKCENIAKNQHLSTAPPKVRGLTFLAEARLAQSSLYVSACLLAHCVSLLDVPPAADFGQYCSGNTRRALFELLLLQESILRVRKDTNTDNSVLHSLECRC